MVIVLTINVFLILYKILSYGTVFKITLKIIQQN